MTSALGYDVFVSEPIPQHITELVPNGDRFMWSPLSATLIRGTNDAVLVDPPFTTEQGHAWATGFKPATRPSHISS
jgi:hypothetical protein